MSRFTVEVGMVKTYTVDGDTEGHAVNKAVLRMYAELGLTKDGDKGFEYDVFSVDGAPPPEVMHEAAQP